jgi:hypothetical protein
MVGLLMYQIVNKDVILNVFILDNVSSKKKKTNGKMIVIIFNLDDLNLPNGILYSRSCPPSLWFSTLNDRCDYPSAVKC